MGDFLFTGMCFLGYRGDLFTFICFFVYRGYNEPSTSAAFASSATGATFSHSSASSSSHSQVCSLNECGNPLATICCLSYFSYNEPSESTVVVFCGAKSGSAEQSDM